LKKVCRKKLRKQKCAFCGLYRDQESRHESGMPDWNARRVMTLRHQERPRLCWSDVTSSVVRCLFTQHQSKKTMCFQEYASGERNPSMLSDEGLNHFKFTEERSGTGGKDGNRLENGGRFND
jgi:hypothetical protein